MANGGDQAARTADELVAQVDTGGREPEGWQRKAFLTIAFVWSVFHIYIASNVPFTLTEWTGVDLTLPSSQASTGCSGPP